MGGITQSIAYFMYSPKDRYFLCAVMSVTQPPHVLVPELTHLSLPLSFTHSPMGTLYLADRTLVYPASSIILPSLGAT